MASSTSIKSQSLQNCALSYDVKWTSNNGEIGSNGSSPSRSSKKRSRDLGDSSFGRASQSDAHVTKAAVMDSESGSRNQAFECAGNVNRVSSSFHDRWLEYINEKKFSDRLSDKSDKKMAAGSHRLIEKAEEQKAIHKTEKLEKKNSSSDRLIETLEKKATGSDGLILKHEKKATFSDRVLEKSEKKRKLTATASDRLTEKSDKKVIISDPSVEKGEEKLEDGSLEQGAEAIYGGEESEVKTWNLRPRKPVSKKPNVNGATPYNNGDALLQEAKKPPKSKAKKGSKKIKNKTTHADSKEKKMVFSIPLSKEEIEEDIFMMTGSKPARRPKKRAKTLQRKLDSLFPGLWLNTITPKSYKVAKC